MAPNKFVDGTVVAFVAGVPNVIGLVFAVDPTFPNWKAPVSVNKITADCDKISLLKKTCFKKCKNIN